MKNKLIKKGGALFLALFLFFTTLFPFNAYAASTMSWSGLQMYAYFDGYSVGRKGYGTITDTRKQNTCQEINFSFDIIDKLDDDDLLTVSMTTKSKRYGGFNVTYRFSIGSTLQGGYSIAEKTFKVTLGGNTDDYEFVENAEGCVLTIKNIPIDYSTKFNDYEFYRVDVSLTDIEYVYASGGDLPFAFSIDKLTAVTDSVSNNFFGNILSWLKNILDSIKNLPSSIGSFITSLGDKISGFFTNLTNNLKTWFDNIGKWFTDLGNNIKSWFNALFNKLWWGNENGESEYTPPVFSSGLMDVLDTIAEYCDSLDNTLAQIENASSSASEYINQGTSVINSVLGVLPSAVIVLITFGIVFIFSRKVVGR